MTEKPMIPDLEAERLFLRGLRLSDAENYQKRFAHWEIARWLNHNIPWPYPPDGAKSFIQNIVLPRQGKDCWFWGIFLKENQQDLIGCMDLRRKGNPGNRGFWLAKEHWGKGLMTEAVFRVLDFAFKELGFGKLTFDGAAENAASRRIKEKTGCRLIRTEPRKFCDPKLKEISEIWELTKEDWLKFTGNKA